MPTHEEITSLARTGAESVYNYIKRTAEVTPSGTRWQTLGFENEPVYHSRIFGGCAGISFFLADYYKTLGIEKAKDLAIGCGQWCTAFDTDVPIKGLLIGYTGVAFAQLHLANTLGDASLLSPCHTHAEYLLSTELGPEIDLFCGVAGHGLFLHHLWQSTQNEKYLAGALQHGDWLIQHAIHNEHGCLWPWRLQEKSTLFGFAHGNSGIAHFLLLLYQATHEPKWKTIVQDVIDTLNKNAIPDQGGFHWPRIPDPDPNEILRCQWCNGSPGIGLFFTQASEILQDKTCLETAIKAGETTYAYGDIRQNPTQCHGLTGNAELFIELYRLTNEQRWLDRAYDFAKQSFKYRTISSEGDLWQADDEGYYSQDFCYGAAGVGHFFLRLINPLVLKTPLL